MHDTRSLLALAAVVVFVILSTRRAAGRLGPRVAVASVIFLASRWPVLVAWIVGAAYWLILLVSGMQAKGLDSPGNYATAAVLALVCGGGVAVMVAGPIFFLVRAFAPTPGLALEPGEELLLECGGGHYLGGEGRGGKLLVTSKRIAFRPHRFNVQLATWSLSLGGAEASYSRRPGAVLADGVACTQRAD